MIHENSDKLPIAIPDEYQKSKLQWQVFMLSLDGLAHIEDWFEKMMALTEFLRRKTPRNRHKHKAPHYLILWQVYSNGDSIWLEFPTRKGWTDFIWKHSRPFVKVTDGQVTSRPSYQDLAADLWAKKHENPTMFVGVSRLLERFTRTGIMPSSDEFSQFCFSVGNSLEHIFMCIGIGYVEQCNKNSSGLGIDMSYGLYPPSPERVRESIDMPNGKLTLRWSLHEELRYDMDLKQVIEMIETHWVENEDKKEKPLFTCDGFWPGVDGAAHLNYTRTKPFVFAFSTIYRDILLDTLQCAAGGLHLLLHEENHNQAALEYWFNHDIKPFANKLEGQCACFDHGYVMLTGNGTADVCLYQQWTEQNIVDAMKHKRKITKHKLTNEKKDSFST